MKFIETHLPGVIVIEPQLFGDKRGFFLESYREDVFHAAGITVPFVQDNHSRSTRGVLRGLHYQLEHTQGKLVRIATGSVFDVVVDVRLGSPTFGKWYGIELNEENMRMLYIPPGYAHGFVVLSDIADFIYKCTDYYHPQSEQGIAWNDPDIAIDWQISSMLPDVSLSDKDKNNVNLKDQLESKFPTYQDFILDIEK